MNRSKLIKLRTNAWSRSLAVTVAGARAGGAIAAHKLMGRFENQQQRDTRNSKVLRREARRFVEELGKLKGSYVKVGQMLATVAVHVLPKELADELHALEDSTVPIEWRLIEPILMQQLGSRYQELQIDREPIAAASLGQVHRAMCLADGRQLCLKVQYPGIAQTIDSDIDSVARMLVLARWISAGEQLDNWLADIRRQLHEEVDYSLEADRTEWMSTALVSDARYKTPEVIRRFSTSTVLCLEYIVAVDVNDEAVSKLSLCRRNKLAKAMLELFFLEIYRWGVFQCDPNFGNYRIALGEANDQLVLLDFGAMRSMDNQFVEGLGGLISAARIDDVKGLIARLEALGFINAEHPDRVKESFADFCLMLMEPLRCATPKAAYLNADGCYCWAQSQLIRRATKEAAISAVSVYFQSPPEEFVIVARKLGAVFTFIASLDAQFNGGDLLERYISVWLEHGNDQ